MKGSKFRMVVLHGYILAHKQKPKRTRWDKLLAWCEERLTRIQP